MGALDHPAAGAKAGVALELLLLLAAGADVRGEAVFVEELVHLGVVVALVQTDPLRFSSGVRPGDDDALERRAKQLEVVDVRARDLDPERDAPTLAEQ